MAEKVQIALVGGQNIPIYNGIMEAMPDLAVLVHSKKTKEQAELLASLVSLQVELVEIDAFDYNYIQKTVNEIIAKQKQSEITVNLTGGTKIMSLATFSLAKNHSEIEFWYIDQNNRLFNFNTEKSHLINAPNINTSFLLNGFEIKSMNKISEYSNEKLNVYKGIRELIEFSDNQFYQLISYLAKYNNHTEYSTKQGSYYEYNKTKKQVNILLKSGENQMTKIFNFEKCHSFIINTTWFELEIAEIFQKWKHTKELLHNVTVPYSSGQDKNEIDLIVNTGKKLLFVECKTKVYDIKDIDKFRNGVKNYGGLGAKSILITDKQSNNRVIEKCNDNNILTFSLEEAKNNNSYTVEQQLFIQLESELSYNNTK